MLGYFLLILAGLGLAGGGTGLGAIGLFVALDCLIRAGGGEVTLHAQLLLLVYVVSVPVSAFLAGAVLDRLLLNTRTSGIFGPAAMVAGFALLLTSPRGVEYLLRTVEVFTAGNVKYFSTLLVSQISAILFCGGIIATGFLLCQAGAEFTVGWIQRCSGVRIYSAMPAVRLAVLLTILALSTHLLSDLLLQELWPVQQ